VSQKLTCLVTDAACKPGCPCVNCRASVKVRKRSPKASPCDGKPHIPWTCSSCGKEGRIWTDHDTPLAEVVEHLFLAHYDDSPQCKASKMGELSLAAMIGAAGAKPWPKGGKRNA
jgi:hypothetical protein